MLVLYNIDIPHNHICSNDQAPMVKPKHTEHPQNELIQNPNASKLNTLNSKLPKVTLDTKPS